jgi:hypothetical protein
MSHKGITDSLHSAKQYLQMDEIELQISLEIGQLSIQKRHLIKMPALFKAI